MASPNPSSTARIQAQIGSGFLLKLFGRRNFIQCVVELLKNARDWGATNIWLDTSDRKKLVILDNGRGMNSANRNAFASINLTTAGAGQAGLFDTGSKWMLFAQSGGVRVVTVSDEEPDFVYMFEFSATEYERLALGGGTIIPTREPKTAENWTHPFSTGTQITYSLRNPSRTGILRGHTLAVELAARLPMKFRDVLRVDDEELPAKQVVGSVFRLSEEVEGVGAVTLELYRPRQRRPEEDLRVTGVEVGEAPFGSLLRVLPDGKRVEVPTLYMLPVVCGTIVAQFLAPYMTEDRAGVDAGVGDDPHTDQLIRLLVRVAPSAARALQIKTEDSPSGPQDRELGDLREACARKYGRVTGPEETGPGSQDGPPGNGPDDDNRVVDTVRDPIILECPHEVALNEEFTATARLRSRGTRTVAELHWDTARSNSKVQAQTPGELRLKASALGHGMVSVDLPGTPWNARAHFEVVSHRVFRLSSFHARMRLGGEMFLTAVNADTLPGDQEIDWSIDGRACHMRVEGKRVWISGLRSGIATVHAYARADHRIHASCDITVVGKEADLLRIREHLFELRPYDVPDGAEHQPPVQMLRGAGKVNMLTWNTGSQGLSAARVHGSGLLYLAQVVSAEFARFCRFDLANDQPVTDLRDLRGIQQRLAADADEVFAELLGALDPATGSAQ